MEISHLHKVSLHGVAIGEMDCLKLSDKVCLEHKTFIGMDRLKFLPDASSSSLAFDLDKRGAVNGSIDDLAEHHLLLLIVINLFFMGFQLVIGKWRLSSGFKEVAIPLL